MDNPIGHGWQAAPEDVYGPPPTPQLSRLLSGGYVSAYYLWLLLWPVNLSPDYSHASIPLLEGLVGTPRHATTLSKVSVKYCQSFRQILPKYAKICPRHPDCVFCVVAPCRDPRAGLDAMLTRRGVGFAKG